MLTYTAIAPAKINLKLRVFLKGKDEGFHKVENTMQTLSLHDRLTFSIPENDDDYDRIRSLRNRKINDYYGIKEAPTHTFKQGNLSITILIDDHTGQNLEIPIESNLITKAILKSAEVSDIKAAQKPNDNGSMVSDINSMVSDIKTAKVPDIGGAHAPTHIEVWVEKNIPAQAGLGGGSSDAAATLQMTKKLFSLNDGVIFKIASSLGADVPFFLTGGRAAMSDTGAVLAEALPSLKVPVVLVKPECGISTKECYDKYDTMSDTAKPMGKFGLLNDLQKPACELETAISDVIKLLEESCDPENVLMTGSGSACFAICNSFEEARKTAAKATSQGYWTRACSCANIKANLID